MFTSPQVGITLRILQALYYKPIGLAQLNPTFFRNGITPRNDLLVKLSIGREGDIFLLHSGVHDDFFSLLDFVLMQGYREGQ